MVASSVKTTRTKVVRTQARKHWFHDKTPAQKKAYITAHPNSVYAKQSSKHKNSPAAHKKRIKARNDQRADKVAKLREEGIKLARALDNAQNKAEFHNERYQDMKKAGKPFASEKKLYEDGLKQCRKIEKQISDIRDEYKRLTE